MSKLFKNDDVQKASFKRLPELSEMGVINSNFSVLLFAC